MTTSAVNSNSSNPYAFLNGPVGSTASTGTTGSSSSATSASSIQNEFLTLLTTQLKNQDPTSPMDPSAMTTQLAEISSVEGIQNLNTTMTALAQAFQSGQSTTAASLIGLDALTTGNQLTLGQNPSTGALGAVGGVNLASAATAVTVNVLDAHGNQVDSIGLGAQKSGVVQFGWNGTESNGSTAAPGNYTFQVTATSGGNAVQATALNLNQINSVSWNSTGQPVLNMGDGSAQTLQTIYGLM